MAATVRVWVYSLADGVLVQEFDLPMPTGIRCPHCGARIDDDHGRSQARWTIERSWDTCGVLARPMRVARSEALVVATCGLWDEPVVMVPDRKGGE